MRAVWPLAPTLARQTDPCRPLPRTAVKAIPVFDSDFACLPARQGQDLDAPFPFLILPKCHVRPIRRYVPVIVNDWLTKRDPCEFLCLSYMWVNSKEDEVLTVRGFSR